MSMMVAVETVRDSTGKTSLVQGEQTAENKDYWRLPNTADSNSACTICSSGTQTTGSEPESKQSRSVSCSSGDSSTVCRICQDCENIRDLTTLCNCTGSIAKYHVSCLEQWLSVSNSDVCELCRGRFQTKRKPKPFVEWLRGLRSNPQSRYIYGDILCFFILTPMALASAALCAEGSWYYMSIGQLVIAFGLIFLCVFLIFLYFVWLLLSVRYHRMMWHKWRLENQVVKLVVPASPTTTITAVITEMKETLV